MPTIRDTLQQELLARLQTLSGYVVGRRQPGANDANHAKLALLLEVGETVLESDTMTTTKELTLEVLVQVRAGDAPSGLGGNPERYVLEEMGAVEGALLTPPWLTNGEQLQPLGSRVVPDEEGSLVRGLVTISIVYRHNIGDPSTFNPMVVS